MSLRRTRPLGRLCGFTLVELVVVIALIGLLSAILFPVFIKAKEGARTSECLSNIRQLGAGLHMYLNQYDSRFPPAIPWGIPGSVGDSTDKTIQDLLHPYVRSGMVKDAGSGSYVRAGVFGCPSDCGIPTVDERGNHFDIVNGVPAGEVVWKHTGCSYEYYAANQEDWLHWEADPPRVPWTALSPKVRSGEVSGRIGAPMWSIVSSTKKAVLGDIWFWHMGDQVPVGLLAYRNTLFADGHAARVRGEQHIECRLQQLRRWHTYEEIQ